MTETSNDAFYAYLGSLGHTGSLDDRTQQWLNAAGFGDGSLNDRWNAFLVAAGFTNGTISDRQRAYFISLGADADSTLDDAAYANWLGL